MAFFPKLPGSILPWADKMRGFWQEAGCRETHTQQGHGVEHHASCQDWRAVILWCDHACQYQQIYINVGKRKCCVYSMDSCFISFPFCTHDPVPRVWKKPTDQSSATNCFICTNNLCLNMPEWDCVHAVAEVVDSYLSSIWIIFPNYIHGLRFISKNVQLYLLKYYFIRHLCLCIWICI